MTLKIEGYQHARTIDLAWVEIEGKAHKVREWNQSLYAPNSTVTYCGIRTNSLPFPPFSASGVCSECEWNWQGSGLLMAVIE